MLFNIDKLIENTKQDPRKAYLQSLGEAIVAVSRNNQHNTNNYHFNSETDLKFRKEFVEMLHKSAMEVINTLNTAQNL